MFTVHWFHYFSPRMKSNRILQLWHIMIRTDVEDIYETANFIFKKPAWKYYTLTMTMTGGREKG